ncbi:MAG: ABC transporter substrate-binding protein [Cryomorphaceae bacterium]|nr:ABC transporter substrate-binding protein [Cryomorphaceae bacterium]
MKSMAINKIRCAGVPEHFCYPWRMVSRDSSWSAAMTWTEFPGGTGAMSAALRNGEIDVAVLLTEGAVAEILKGNPSSIYSYYVDSPLNWGVHVNSASHISSVADIEQPQFAISRFNSGSHLMAFLYCRDHAWELNDRSFEVVNNLDGARQSMREHTDQLFMWEKFTTKPWVDSGEFRRIDEYIGPWSSFVIVVRNEMLTERPTDIKALVAAVQSAASHIKAHPRRVDAIARAYGLDVDDAKTWFENVRWSRSTLIDRSDIKKVAQSLAEVGVLNETDDAALAQVLFSSTTV